MEKQYSVQFFTNFVENLQNLCHSYLDFEQCVEVSGYVCVEIDNIKKERFVLSEIIQSNGRSISESYCTKVFKSSPSSMIQRNNFKDITNRNHEQRSHLTYDRSFPQTVSGNQRPRFGQNVTSQSTSRSSVMVHQRNDTQQQSQYSSFPSSEFRNMGSKGAQISPSVNEDRSRGFSEESILKVSRNDDTSFELTDNTETGDTESAEDGDIIIVKTEPSRPEEMRDSEEPPPAEETGESLRLPESLLSGGGQSTSLDEDFSDTMPSIDFNTSDCDLQMDSYPTSTFSQNLSFNTMTIFNSIRPKPHVVDTPEGKKITCLLCRNVAWAEADFVLHMKVHPSCKECGCFLMSHIDLRSHMQKEHGRTSMFKCNFCEKVFLSKGGMMEHQRLKHEKTAPRFVCVICRHVCVRKRHLEDHIENVHKKRAKDTLDVS